MSPGSRKNVLLRRAGVTLVVGLALYAAAGSILSHYYKGLVLSKLPSLAAKATDSLYNITVQDIRVNIFTRAVTVTGLRMSVNLDVLQRRRAEGRPPHVVLDVSVPEAEVAGVRWRELKKERELTCRRVHFQDPQIRIQVLPGWRERPKRAQAEVPTVSRVYANHITIDEPHFDVRYSYGTDGFTVQSTGGHIVARNWDYRPRRPFDTSRFFGAGMAEVRLDAITYRHLNDLYQYGLGSIQFKTAEQWLSLHNAVMKPALAPEAIYAQVGHRKTLYECTLPVARLRGFAWKQLIAADHKLIAERLELDTPQLAIHLNKRPPPDSTRRPGYYPVQWLQRLSLPTHIKLITVHDGSVKYSETNAKTGATGSLLFSYLRGNILNVTNMPQQISAAPECRLFAHCKLAYRANLAAVIRFSLESSKGAFSLGARLRGLDAGSIREAVNAMAIADVKSLRIPDAAIRLQGNEDSIWGRSAIQYSRLKVKLKKWSEQDSGIHARPLMNFLANKLLLYDANPMPGEPVRTAMIGLPRGGTRSFLQMVWKGIFQASLRTAIREEGAYSIAQRRKAAKGKPKQKFFKGLFPKRR